MAGISASPGFSLTPSSEPMTLQTNYLGSADFDFLRTELPDLYEQEFERYGDRSIASFLRMFSAEFPSTSDLIKWTEEGRLQRGEANYKAGKFLDNSETVAYAETISKKAEKPKAVKEAKGE